MIPVYSAVVIYHHEHIITLLNEPLCPTVKFPYLGFFFIHPAIVLLVRLYSLPSLRYITSPHPRHELSFDHILLYSHIINPFFFLLHFLFVFISMVIFNNKYSKNSKKFTTHSFRIIGGRAVEHVSEGAESTEFWSFLGGKAPYPATSKG